VPKYPSASATNSGTVPAAVRAACIQIQSLPSCTGSAAADSANMNPTSSSVMPSVTAGARPISGTNTSKPRCCECHRLASVNPPPPMTAAITRPTGAGTQW
jgi:hypothetical protein